MESLFANIAMIVMLILRIIGALILSPLMLLTLITKCIKSKDPKKEFKNVVCDICTFIIDD